MSVVTLEHAQANLSALVAGLKPGDEVIVTLDDQPVARLLPALPVRKPRRAGNCRGMMTIVVDDDAHLVDFAEYMP